MLSFTSVYFFESGLFNGLPPIQLKISLPVSAPQKSQPDPPLLTLRHWRRFDPANELYITDSYFQKEIVTVSAGPLA
jgi:hypothetical protein